MDARAREDAQLRELPEGMLEYEARVAIRNLFRLYGKERGREMVANYVNDEFEPSTRQ